MYSLSTSWNSFRHKSGDELVGEIKSIGFDTIELNFAMTESMVKDILALTQRSEIKVSSLHNICPLPAEIGLDEASPDYYSLASPDEEERELAVGVAKNTIRYARMFGAKAVVLHAGRVQIKDRMRELAALTGDTEAFNALKAQMIRERDEKKGGYLDNVIKSLAELVPYASQMKVLLGIENRYYYREIPLIDELEAIFNNFNSGEVFYWHDAGHAEVFDRLGITKHEDLLERFANRLIGVHLHDIMGVMDDHKPPGLGTFDFRILKPYLKKDTIKVIEAHHPATANQIRKGAEYLKKIFGA
ncbi:MAG: sugar phosphate isomerase/epimerase family protein [Candidatus Omnitrophota bacterium]|nr:sugar phosphate isomerase/epimerase family protein [Candidatus Omnitrophota bacterium]